MKKRIALVTGDFHQKLAEEMVSFAIIQAKELDIEVVQDIRVAGSYEVPLVLDALLVRDDIDAAVALGYIEKGETLHGEIMGHVVHDAFVQLQLKYKKPVGVGIIGPGATMEQAQVRKEGTAKGAVKAVVRSLKELAKLDSSQDSESPAEQ